MTLFLRCPFLLEGGELIRSLFFQENPDNIELLPCLPADFHCGRMVGIRASNKAVFDFEWTKKTLRSVFIHPMGDEQISLKLPKGIRSFRLRKEKSLANVAVDSKGIATLLLQGNKIVHLDRFEY